MYAEYTTRTRARLWMRAARLTGKPLAPPAGEDRTAPAAAAPAAAASPWREESRLARCCALSVLTGLTTALGFAVLFQREEVPSFLTDEAAVRLVARHRIARAIAVARSEGDVATADWLEALP